MKFAALIPLKGEGGLEHTCANVRALLQTLTSSRSTEHTLCVVYGLDQNDPTLDTPEGTSRLCSVALEAGVDTPAGFTRVPPSKPASICQLWNDMARVALGTLNADYFVLLGDDVRFLQPEAATGVEPEGEGRTFNWMDRVDTHFRAHHPNVTVNGSERSDFGCVALNDVTNPGFPTFPVIGRTHLDLFDGECVPVPPFVNQDGDPFLYALYRRWGASSFLTDVKLRNEIGGTAANGRQQPRYERQHIDWRGDVLSGAVDRVAQALGDEQNQLHRRLVIDCVTPSYRVNMAFLRGIVSQPVPDSCSVMFVVVVDDPDATMTELSQLEHDMAGRLRVRQHKVNRGASAARNTGINECDGDWIIFLDDDVIPSNELIEAYAQAIREHGNGYDGFVGVTELPHERRVFAHAVHMSDVSFFWTIALHMEEVPWGVTANIAVRRLSVPNFDVGFIKTGGGEDIDYCLRLQRWPMRSVPEAHVLHPWWDGGSRCYNHFYRWAAGDSLLQEKYPEHTYYSFPNCLEIIALLVPVLVASAGVSRTALWFLCVLLTDMGYDLARNMFVADRLERLPARGWLRILASMEGSIVKWSTDVGHLVSPVLDRGSFSHVSRRFDWFCGLQRDVRAGERQNQMIRFIFFMVSFVACVMF